MKYLRWFPLLALLLAFLASACGGKSEKTYEASPDRGRYIYDDRNVLPPQSEVALASYLWKLDSSTNYEIVFVFPKETMDETAMIGWFNAHGVGKRGKDTGAAVFVLPDNDVFISIGSGNDKVSVAFSKTAGEKIFAGFSKDPALTLLRFSAGLGGKIISSSGVEFGGGLFEGMKEHMGMILLWAAFIALVIFLIQQIDGFQPTDLLLPAGVFVVLGIFFGGSALAAHQKETTYTSYGMVTSSKLGSYTWVHTHEICTSSEKTTTCTSYPHVHTMYTNDVQILSYGMNDYAYRFETDESKDAWRHGVGEIDALTLTIKDDGLVGVTSFADNSGGKTIGDGVWIHSAKGTT